MKNNEFEMGLLWALEVVYAHDAETIAEEIVGACDTRALLRVARREEVPRLPDLLRTIMTIGTSKRSCGATKL